jgi:DNA-binding beta-propeller fold protein YncE
MPVRVRLLPPAVLAAGALFLVVASAAWGLGELTQKPGEAGCFANAAIDGCTVGRALDRPHAVAVSPDGRNVYVAVNSSKAIAIFDRDPLNGALTQKPGTAGCISQNGTDGCEAGRRLDSPEDVAVSPDGHSVYVATGFAVAIFDRAPDGRLLQKPGMDGCISGFAVENCQVGRAMDRPRSIAITADGGSVYLADEGTDAVLIFDLGPEGKLTQKPGAAGCVSKDGTDRVGGACLQARGLDDPRDLALSPDNRNVYVASETSQAVAIFDRKPDGALVQKPAGAACVSLGGAEGCQQGRGLILPRSIVVDPSGANVYVGSRDGILAIFDRDPEGRLVQKPGTDGCLAILFTQPQGCQVARGVAGFALALSPDGRTLYSASGFHGMAIMDRDLAGRLTQKPGAAGCFAEEAGEGCDKARGLLQPNAIATSPDGKSVYVAGFDEEKPGTPSALVVFDRAVPPPPPDTVAPDIAGFKLSPPRLRRGSKRGSSFRFELSEPASVRIAIERIRPGRKVGKRCKAPRPKLAKRRACRRFTGAGALDFAGRPQGSNAIRFSGKVGKRALRLGRYRATIVATDAAGNGSVPRRAGFAVLPRRK